MKRLPARLLTILAAALTTASLLAIASACGGDGSSPTPNPTPTGVATLPPTTAPSPTPTTPPIPTPTPTAVAAAAPCPADLIAFGIAQQSGGAIGITIKFSVSNTGAPCTFSGPVKVRMLDSGGVPLLGMAENPVTFTAASPTLLLSWRNWCAAPGTFRASVSAGNATTLVGIPGPPSCTAPKDKSMLSLAMP